MPTTRILIVEDDHASAEVLDYNLRAKATSHASYEGRDGLGASQLKMPDIVILDVMLPMVDGIEVCRQLRAAPETRHANIIMLTAKSEEADQWSFTQWARILT